MSNKFLYLTKISLLKKIKTKTFLVVNILLLIVLLALTNVDSIIKSFGGDFSHTNNIMIVDNTNEFYDLFKNNIDNNQLITFKYKLKKMDNEKESKKKIKKEKDILLVVNSDEKDTISVKLITYGYINSNVYTSLETITNDVKKELSLSRININKEELSRVTKSITLKREFIEGSKNALEERNNLILNLLFPIVIMPFFLFTISVIQMIGAEINEEKSTRSMEMIISNVSAKCHFFSKVLATNLYVVIQGILLFIYSGIGMLFRTTKIDISSLNSTIQSANINIDLSMFSKLIDVIPVTIIIMLITLFAYSLLAGILASVTTNMEDFQQMQMPIVVLTLASFYLSIASAMFNGSLFIKIISYFPFISSILSPCLYLTGVLGLKDVIISIVIMIIVIYLLIKYGLKVYKNGILNYSGNNLWKRIFKSLKE
ncbi:MAG: ABC transporter permease [Bacilli bacterium]|nr:ABC transporter permease [Bacilli bacterium]